MGRQGIRTLGVQVEHLTAGPEGKPQALNNRRSANPAAAGGGRDHVALPVDGIQVGGVTDVSMPESEVPDGSGPDAESAAVVGSDIDGRIGRDPVSDIPRAHLQRGAFANQMAPRSS